MSENYTGPVVMIFKEKVVLSGRQTFRTGAEKTVAVWGRNDEEGNFVPNHWLPAPPHGSIWVSDGPTPATPADPEFGSDK